MNFTFGIITTGDEDAKFQIGEIIDSIDRQSLRIPDYQIIIVGGEDLLSRGALVKLNVDPHVPLEYVPFDETTKPGWKQRRRISLPRMPNMKT